MKKNLKPVISYKAFEFDWTCRGYDFGGPGKTSVFKGDISLCNAGFHSCLKIEDVFKYYQLLQSYKYAEIENYGEILYSEEDSKICASKIKIIKELSFKEVIDIIKKQTKEDNSYGVRDSYGVHGSSGVSDSYGVSYSSGVSDSYGVSSSYGVSDSYGVHGSYGVRDSYGVHGSYGVRYSSGVYKGIFCYDLPRQAYLFNKPVTEERVDEVRREIERLNDGWHPNFTNIKELYLKVGSSWDKVPLYRLKDKTNAEAWADMPKATIEYLRSLPEFDAKVFEAVTGIKTEAKK